MCKAQLQSHTKTSVPGWARVDQGWRHLGIRGLGWMCTPNLLVMRGCAGKVSRREVRVNWLQRDICELM